MSFDKKIASIIDGQDIEHTIDLLLNEGALDDLKRFLKSRKWQSRLISLGIAGAAGYGMYRLSKKGNKCSSELKVYVGILTEETYRRALNAGIDAAVALAYDLALDTTKSRHIAGVVSSCVRRSLRHLLPRVQDLSPNDNPSASDIEQAANAGVDDIIPLTGGAGRLKKTRDMIMRKGTTGRGVVGRVTGLEAYTIWLGNLYKGGIQSKWPLCIWMLQYAGQVGAKGEWEPGMGSDELHGVSEVELISEFKEYLYDKESGKWLLGDLPEPDHYPKFRL